MKSPDLRIRPTRCPAATVFLMYAVFSCAVSVPDLTAAEEPKTSAEDSVAGDAAAAPQDAEFFERRIRPLLAEHCFECHGEQTQKASLRLDSRSSLLRGGDLGPAVIPGDPDGSLLLQAVRYEDLEMPPAGRLSDTKIRLLTEWIRRGAQWPGKSQGHPSPTREAEEITEEDRRHWAFQPIRSLAPPSDDPAEHPIDAFVNRKLAEAGLVPNAAASARVLIRRVWFGLTGLPPTFDELNQWERRLSVSNGRINADEYAAMLTELLSRPAYGEHWARHWLDVVRYAQTNGYERDGYKPYS
ncbi:MAG: DUF1549 domain-containing protein, partial [Planctomycetaceae bacterium]|nr:DUF1549 domain-containing protein [Planctomycetaceae bacterium]